MRRVRTWTVVLTDTEMRQALDLFKNHDSTTPSQDAAADHLWEILRVQFRDLIGIQDYEEAAFKRQFPGRQYIRIGDEPEDVQTS